MNAKTLLTIQSVLLTLLIVVVTIGIVFDQVNINRLASLAAQPASPTVAVLPESELTVAPPTALPTLAPTGVPTATGPTPWEYLGMAYGQYDTFSDDPDLNRYEIVLANTEPYTTAFINAFAAGCERLEGIAKDECYARNFKGQEYFLNTLGQDGWELIHVDNQSSQYVYQVEMLFKRPLNP